MERPLLVATQVVFATLAMLGCNESGPQRADPTSQSGTAVNLGELEGRTKDSGARVEPASSSIWPTEDDAGTSFTNHGDAGPPFTDGDAGAPFTDGDSGAPFTEDDAGGLIADGDRAAHTKRSRGCRGSPAWIDLHPCAHGEFIYAAAWIDGVKNAALAREAAASRARAHVGHAVLGEAFQGTMTLAGSEIVAVNRCRKRTHVLVRAPSEGSGNAAPRGVIAACAANVIPHER